MAGTPTLANVAARVAIRRQNRFRLLAVLYREALGTPDLPVSLPQLQDMSGLEPELFRLTLKALEAYQFVHARHRNEPTFRAEWDGRAVREVGDGARDDRDPSAADFTVQLTDRGHGLFEYMLLHPEEDTEIFGAVTAVWPDGVFRE